MVQDKIEASFYLYFREKEKKNHTLLKVCSSIHVGHSDSFSLVFYILFEDNKKIIKFYLS